MMAKNAHKNNKSLAIILAAGEGSRMLSALPKVLHEVGSLPLIGHVAGQFMKLKEEPKLAFVLGKNASAIETFLQKKNIKAEIFYQEEPLGTAHAALAAHRVLLEEYPCVFLAFGDTPLIRSSTLQMAQEKICQGAQLLLFGFYTEKPFGYGRLLEKKGKIACIVEEKDATEVEKNISYCNGGIMAVSGKKLLSWLRQVKADNAQKEFYLTDIVKIAIKEGARVEALTVEQEEVLGVNTRADLAHVENIWQGRKREEALKMGATLRLPETIYFSYDTQLAQDVVVEPHVYFAPGVTVGSHSHIRSFSHLEGVEIGEGVQIGPFARIRSKSKLAKNVKIGNFCEIKNTQIEEGAKINHLSYMGDSFIGAGSNIGAGTISCNYDGVDKYTTHIGQNSFVGSNTCLVAPVKIGKGAYIATATIVTKDVPAGALAIGRVRQENKLGYAVKLRKQKQEKEKT